MERGKGFETPAQMLEGVREARINMLIFSHDSQVQSEVAAPCRLMWKHVPELARRMDPTLELRPEEGYPDMIKAGDAQLLSVIARDMKESRDIVGWMSAVTTPETRAVFARGADNALDAMMEAHARDRGFTRDDAIAEEAGRAVQAQEDRRRPSPAVMASVMAQRSMG
jgi:hypothetical protein